MNPPLKLHVEQANCQKEDDPLSIIPPTVLQYIETLLRLTGQERATRSEIASFLREILDFITILRQRSLRDRGS